MRLLGLAALSLLSACSAEREPAPAPSPTATVAVPRTLIAADFDRTTLGGVIEGTETSDVMVGDRLARVTALVACPKELTECDPATAPEGTVYTYVLTVTPELAPPIESAPTPVGATGPGETPVAPLEAPAELVRTTRVVPGFNAAVGYSKAEAEAALGAAEALTVTLDQNQLIWRVTGGSGWQAGKPITLYWQSTRPPAGPAAAYRLEYGGKRADISAPFPEADKPEAPRK